MSGLRYNTGVTFLKNYDQFKAGDKILAGNLDLSLVAALIKEGKAQISVKAVAPETRKKAKAKSDETLKNEVDENADSTKDSADGRTDNDDGSEEPSTD